MIPLFEQFRNDKYSWTLIGGLILIIVQAVFGDWGFLFPAALFGAMVYYGKNKTPSRKGKIIFWIGIAGLIFTVVNLIVFKLVILILLIFLVYEFVQNKKHPKHIFPAFHPDADDEAGSETVSGTPLLKNKWFGYQKTPDGDYEWQDINIQTGAGDTLIDLSRTILPKKESVIFIRHFAGRVRILVPYGVEAALQYSMVLGQLQFFDRKIPQLVNSSLTFETKDYAQAEQKVKIFVSGVAGNLEVRRI